MVELRTRVGDGDGELLLDVEYPDDRPLDITAHTEKFIERVETNLGWARVDISRFNSDLPRIASSATILRPPAHVTARQRGAGAGRWVGYLPTTKRSSTHPRRSA